LALGQSIARRVPWRERQANAAVRHIHLLLLPVEIYLTRFRSDPCVVRTGHLRSPPADAAGEQKRLVLLRRGDSREVPYRRLRQAKSPTPIGD